MILEGRNALNEALKGNVTLEKVLVQTDHSPSLGRIIAEIKERKVKLSYVDKSVLDKYSETKSHQGVIAFATDFQYSELEEVLCPNAEGKRLIIILDGIEDPHNLGSIVRIADSVNANGIIIPRHRSCGVTDTVVKVSAGATAYVKIAKVANINDIIRQLKDMGVWVFAADMNGQSLYKSDLTGDMALVVGGEGSGVHSLTSKLADAVISLPQLGRINSLNAAVAAGAILYEAIRQRTTK
ncbi:MAG: 23S rRNA (guanosine(2251)-2'-O)-methyltransferase RlmB [Clostridia bacterium]|nr:23S rRNA (guanosine(2251)-2'-O)-methyltransferase RlmB [Clostridia bacterium]